MARDPDRDESERQKVKTAAIDISPIHLDPRYAEAHARYDALVQRRETLERSGRVPVRVPIETLAEQLLADPSAPLAFKAPDPGLPLEAELAALRMAEQQAERDVRAARDAVSTAVCAKLVPTRRRLIQEVIAGLTAGLEAIARDIKIRQQLNEAGYTDDTAAFASHIDIETLRRLLERAQEVRAHECE
jgi:hypothetical protein